METDGDQHAEVAHKAMHNNSEMESVWRETGEDREGDQKEIKTSWADEWRWPPKPVSEEGTVKAGRHVRQCATVCVCARVCRCVIQCAWPPALTR